MRLYISGPMSNRKDYNYPAFFQMESDLGEMGHEPINPARDAPSPSPAHTWHFYMVRALRLFRNACDAIVVLPEWEVSRGARIEVADAVRRGLTVYRLVNRTLQPVPMSEIRPGLSAMTEEDFVYLHQDIDSLAG